MFKLNKKTGNTSDLEKLHGIMRLQQGELRTLTEYLVKYSPRLLSEIKELINSDRLVKFTNNDIGCYDMEICENGQTYFIEVTLDGGDRVEDIYCSCNSGPCVHVYAMLWYTHAYLEKLSK